MITIENNEITGSGSWNAPRENPYRLMKPWSHESGAYWWIIDPAADIFTDDDGQVYHLRKRTQAELEATPSYWAWAGTQILPTIYATLAFSGGDGKAPILGLKLGHPTKGTMNISGDLRLTPTAPGLPVNVSDSWRITIRKVISEFSTTAIDSLPVDGCAVVNNAITWTGFNPETYGLTAGIYMISDEDFAPIPGALFGSPLDYRVTLVGGAKFFKALK